MLLIRGIKCLLQISWEACIDLAAARKLFSAELKLRSNISFVALYARANNLLIRKVIFH